MLKMTYDMDIESIAINYAKKCIFEHNEDRSNNQWSMELGENLYAAYSTNMVDSTTRMTKAVTAWFNEVTLFKNTASLASFVFDEATGHYT
jgi:hypothetical protein